MAQVNSAVQAALDKLKDLFASNKAALEGDQLTSANVAFFADTLAGLTDDELLVFIEEGERELDEQVVQAYTDGTTADVVISRTQLALLHGIKRDLLMRYANPLRALAHEAGRKQGQSEAGGAIDKAIGGYLSRLIKLAT